MKIIKILILLFILSYPSTAQWLDDSLSHIVLSGNYSTLPEIVTDGNGGFFTIWKVGYSFGPPAIFSQHIDHAGNLLWPSPKRMVYNEATGYFPDYKLMAGSNNDAFIAWHADVVPKKLNYQHFNYNGDTLSIPGGKTIFTTSTSIDHINIIKDGLGGAFIGFDNEVSYPNNTLKVHHVDSAGNTYWPSAKTLALQIRFLDKMISDERGGGYYLYDTGTDKYLNHMDSSGVNTWTGPLFVNRALFDSCENIFLDPISLGAYYTVMDTDAIWIQYVDSSGNKRWNGNGIFLANTFLSNVGFHPQIVSDNQGGVFCYYTYMNNYTDPEAYHVLKHIDASGTSLWNGPDTLVQQVTVGCKNIQLIKDQLGGAILVWEEFRNNRSALYAQRYNSSGIKQWQQSGLPISTAMNYPASLGGSRYYINHRIENFGTDGATVVWQDKRSMNQDYYIYISRVNGTIPLSITKEINEDGFLLYPNPANNFLNVINEKSIDAVYNIYDHLGQEVKTVKTAEKENLIDIHNLSSGIYFMQVLSGDKTYSFQFIKTDM
jgi:hypothetical protein